MGDTITINIAFIRKAKELRKSQKQYFRDRTPAALKMCKRIESEFDDDLQSIISAILAAQDVNVEEPVQEALL